MRVSGPGVKMRSKCGCDFDFFSILYLTRDY